MVGASGTGGRVKRASGPIRNIPKNTKTPPLLGDVATLAEVTV